MALWMKSPHCWHLHEIWQLPLNFVQQSLLIWSVCRCQAPHAVTYSSASTLEGHADMQVPLTWPFKSTSGMVSR